MADILYEAGSIQMAEAMRIIDIQEAQANLEQLIDELKPGEWFAISVDGKPVVKVIARTPEEFERLNREDE
jgi:antitoxin (DNA-binding transcriptional repressor) of toxin-antitoxin stability system